MMMPEKHHIVLKKVRKQLQIWIAEEYLISATGVNPNTLRVKRNSSKYSWKFINTPNGRYYDFSAIPNKAPASYKSKLPTLDELIIIKKEGQKPIIADFSDYFEAALADTDNYTKHYVNLDKTRRDELARAASVVMHTVRYIYETGYNVTKSGLFQKLAALVIEYEIDLPNNEKRLKEKIKAVFNGQKINDIVRLPREGNNNAAKFHEDLQLELWIYDLQSNPKNFSDAYICRQIQRLCKITDRAAPSNETIRLKLSQREAKFITSINRYGAGTRQAAEYEGTVPVANAPFAGDCWQVDATRVNLIAHEHIITDANGNKIKKLENIMACVVRDVHSGIALGYSFYYSENAYMYLNALKMAVEEAGYLPYELVIDRFPGHNTPHVIEFFESLKMMGTKITVAHKATGKAQIERYWSTIQQTEMQGNDYYYGEGIRSTRPAAHVSPEWLALIKKKAKKEGYNITDTVNAYSQMLEDHNARKYSEYSKKYPKLDKSPADLHVESEKPNVIELKASTIKHLFGIKTDVKVQANGLVKVEVLSVANYYLIEDYNIIEQNARVCVSYDPGDMSSVEIFARIKDSHWLKHLCVAQAWAPPQVYGPNAEFNRLAEIKKRQRDINEIRAAKLAAKLQPVLVESNEEPTVFEQFDAEEEGMMGAYTMKKAAGGYEDIVNNPENAAQSIYNQLYNRK